MLHADALAERRLAPAREQQQVDEQQRDDDRDEPPTTATGLSTTASGTARQATKKAMPSTT